MTIILYSNSPILNMPLHSQSDIQISGSLQRMGWPIIWLVLNAIEDLNYDLAVGPWHSLKTNQFTGMLGLLPCQPPEDGLANPSSG